MKKLYALVLSVALLIPAGCATNTGTGAIGGTAGGAAAGALMGQIIGQNTKSTLLGTAIGATLGAAVGTGVGYMMDRQENDMRNALAQSQAASIEREGDMLKLLFKSDMTFASNSYKLSPGLLPEIARVAQILNNYPNSTISVEGHTDSKGSDEYNMTLSEKRAHSVRDQLVNNGVNPARITTIGYGKTQPIDDNTTEIGRAKNRRVEIHIRPTGQAS